MHLCFFRRICRMYVLLLFIGILFNADVPKFEDDAELLSLNNCGIRIIGTKNIANMIYDKIEALPSHKYDTYNF